MTTVELISKYLCETSLLNTVTEITKFKIINNVIEVWTDNDGMISLHEINLLDYITFVHNLK